MKDRRENENEGILENRKGVTDSGRGDTQRMTLPLIHLIEAADFMRGLRRAASPARQASMACPNSRLHVSFVVWLLVLSQLRLTTDMPPGPRSSEVGAFALEGPWQGRKRQMRPGRT